ncbi:MAG: EAL domain protein [Rhodobacteraceae bacterium HLUCCA12]|nr:MAG: EAL domain protein [Rhodobacteraceae bacterium HLUCCA12]
MPGSLAPAALTAPKRLLRRPSALLAIPLLTLALLGVGQSPWLVVAVALVQAGWLILARPEAQSIARRAAPGYPRMTDAETLKGLLAPSVSAPDRDLRPAALVVRVDDADTLHARHGARYVEALMHELSLRLGQSLREDDAFCRLGSTGFAVALFPQRHLELSAVLSVAHRAQSRLGQAFSFEAVNIWPSVSVGFCLSARAAELNGISMLDAAAQACDRALLAGPGGLYSYSAVDLPPRLSVDQTESLRAALDSGAIHAQFQPQLCLATGTVTGVEALARWTHPVEGVITPASFLPQIEAAGLSPKLANRMLVDALILLAQLDAQGHRLARVSINLSGPELRNPNLAEEIAWELDRHNLAPDRLGIEILETVVADSDDDIMVRNIARLAELGCAIDLDDFGTGHASIANIRRFAVARLKIDRSFVTHLHEDAERQSVVAAIVAMAHQLGLGTVAEGVETEQELQHLMRLGCDAAQGFVIARPMRADDLSDWLRQSAESRARRAAAQAGSGDPHWGRPQP